MAIDPAKPDPLKDGAIVAGGIAPDDQQETYQDFDADPAGDAKQTQADVEAALAGVIGKLQAEADRQVMAKTAIETRWLENLRQFYGRYDPTTEQKLKDGHKSRLFVNLTRAKVNSWDARLGDLLFPTDDKNWGIKPVPAPDLSQKVRDSIEQAKQAAIQATAAHQGGNPDQASAIAAQGTQAAQDAASIQDMMEAAEKSSDLMEAEIETQLKESDYNIRSRRMIRDAVKLGTGILKGPVTNNRLKREWVKTDGSGPPQPPSPFAAFQGRKADLAASLPAPNGAMDATGAAPADGAPADGAVAPQQPAATSQPGDLRPWKQAQPQAQPLSLDPNAAGTAYVLNLQPDPAPEFVHVDPWQYFPDMSAKTVEDAEFHFERHLWNAKQLRKGVKEHGLNPDAVGDLIREGARTPMPTYWSVLREITANSNVIGSEMRFHVWEYTGVLDDEDLQAMADATGDQTVIDFVTDNPLLEVPVIIWFCQGRLLKFAPYPLDSCEPLYSVMCFEEDDTSIFGFGVPDGMRDSQSAVNGGWRMMMDNGGLSVGPQIIIDQDMVKPADGNWAVRPMKVWLKSSTSLTKQMPDSYKAFEAANITANQSQLQAIINMAEAFADKETSMPLIAEGGMVAGATKTTGGMSMLMNAANVIFRRVVKNFDDCVSTPNIRRIYDWNMQFNKRDDIKGNYAIDARGSSVLLVKEMQTQTLMSALQNFAANPVIGPMLKTPDLLRKLFAAQMIRADDAVKSDEKIAEEAEARAQALAQQAQAQQQPGKSQAEIDGELEIVRENNQTKIQVALIGQKTALIELAQTHNITLDQLQTELQINANDIAHRERIFAAELGSKNLKPPSDFAGPGIDTGPSGA